MPVLHLLILILGLVSLVGGAELLVKKAVFLANKLHINPFFMGVVLLGMGTSSPEWAVSTLSSIQNLSNLAIANVFGSNIFNILLVLGLILLSPLSKVNIQTIKRDILFLIIGSLLLIPIMWDSFLSRWDALLLSLIFVIYIVISFLSMQKKQPVKLSEEKNKKGFSKEICLILLGFAFLIGGSHFTVKGAVGLSQYLGMSERLIGILIVSVGTGLPELLASLISIIRGHKDMAFGNIIGSNIFNTFAILSTSAWIQPIQMDFQLLKVDLPVLTAIHFTLLLLFLNNKWIKRALPYILFGGYIGYLAFLLLNTTN